MKYLFASAAGLFLAATLAPANAASSDWFVTNGGKIRLVTAGRPDASGILKGALEIRLEPGWKTYWVDPGDAGVPPQIDVSQSRDVNAAQFGFPAPQRFDDGYSVWAGYKHDVALAIDFDTGPAPMIKAGVFLGICEKICIPVQADFSVDPAGGDSDMDIVTVEQAHGSLPRQAAAGFEVRPAAAPSSDLLHLLTDLPAGTDVTELFVASADGWYFGVPKPVTRADGITGYDVPVLGHPQNPGEREIFYTLIAGDDAVAGTFKLEPPATD